MKKKKTTKKRASTKKTKTKKVHVPKSEIQLEKILVENFVSLQKVMVNLSVKFDNLTKQISKLLELFEISAKSLAEKDFDIEKSKKDNTEMIKKIDNLLDQNKTIARGLTLMHEAVSMENPGNNPKLQMPQRAVPPTTANLGGYQKSISSESGIRIPSDQTEKNAQQKFKRL